MSKDHWKINILFETNQSISVVLNKYESVANLFKKFREMLGDAQRGLRLTFRAVDGTELQGYDRRRLIDVGCLRHRCTIQLIVHEDDNGWPTEMEVMQKMRNPRKVPSLEGRLAYDFLDIMGPDYDSIGVGMSCGHVIAPSSLAVYCYKEIENGAHSIRCPVHGCYKEWAFRSFREAACLSRYETNAFERRMLSNRLRNQPLTIKECPACGYSCHRLKENETRIHCSKCASDRARNFEFCWSCLKEWKNDRSTVLCGNFECGDHSSLFEILANCETKKLNGIECFSKRACPKCLMLIDHSRVSLFEKSSTTCIKRSCRYSFCFICLQEGTGTHNPCKLAPRQQPTSLGPPPPNGCTIL